LKAEEIAGLMQLPGIGRSPAHSIDHLARSGRLPLLEQLRGEDAAERTFATVPNIGLGLAQRIHEELGIETLAELESAANDGGSPKCPARDANACGPSLNRWTAGRAPAAAHGADFQPATEQR
jgi:DNA polymerase/3'-5' exonuclease PolX